MFNLGSNDKEELQENMQEIKSLIEDGDQESQQAPQQGGNSTSQTQQNQSNQQSQGQQNPQTQFEQKVAQKAQQNQSQQAQTSTPDITSENTQNQGNSMQNNNSSNNSTGGVQSQQQSQEQPSQPSQEKVINQGDDSNNSGRDASRPSGTGNSPASDEPMFLREEDFLNVREMIEEMTYLTQEMDDNLDKLKKTVHEERNTSKNAMELVQAFSKRRSEIESTIESGQK